MRVPLTLAVPRAGAVTIATPVTTPLANAAKSTVVAVLTGTSMAAALAPGPVSEGVPVPVSGATRAIAAEVTFTCAFLTPTAAGLKRTRIEQLFAS